MIFLDTHVMIWLYEGAIEKIPTAAVKLIEANDLKISPCILLEMQYLHEINRIQVSAKEIYEDLHFRIGLSIDTTEYSRIIQHAMNLHWTRDPFDRLIVAHAIAAGASLLTSDQKILKEFKEAIWAKE